MATPGLARWSGALLIALALLGCEGLEPSVRPSAGGSGSGVLAVSPAPALAERPLASGPRSPTGPTARARVIRIVDGDTVLVEIAGRRYRVRYIGMDTPETVKPDTPVEWLGPQAAASNRALVEGQTVTLEKDVSEVDRFGRLLRYVWVWRGTTLLLVNLALVEQGFAQVSTVPPDVKYVDWFVAAQRSARASGLGLWSASSPP